jgi:hypothetical protein
MRLERFGGGKGIEDRAVARLARVHHALREQQRSRTGDETGQQEQALHPTTSLGVF